MRTEQTGYHFNCFVLKKCHLLFWLPQILLIQPNIPDLEGLCASTAGEEEQAHESQGSW